MVRALFDTNVLIDYLGGVSAARTELRRYEERAISIVTWMEVMIGARAEVEAETRVFLRDGFAVIALSDEIAERAVSLRRQHRLKLPDAVIWASAQAHSALLVTRNTRDFPADTPGVRMPYAL